MMCTVCEPGVAGLSRARPFRPRLEISLGMDRLVDSCERESQMKHRSSTRILAYPDPAALRFDDGAADRQANAHAVRLGGDERLEQTVGDPLRKPTAGVSDPNLDPAVGRGSALDGQLA